MSQVIEKHIAAEEWEQARELILKELDNDPENHWLLTHLGLTYYEQFDYQRALELSKQALAIAPNCPLALWDYAGTLEMLDSPLEAVAVYQSLIERGIDSLAYDSCGEGRARARGLYADCYYRLSHCYTALGQHELAVQAMRHHLEQRGPGCHSIYPLAKIRREMQTLLAGTVEDKRNATFEAAR